MTQNRKLEWRSVSTLIPYARNSRTHSDEQIAQIAASIKEFGWTNPILIDGDNMPDESFFNLQLDFTGLDSNYHLACV